MENKVLRTQNLGKVYKKIADEKQEVGDYLSRLRFLLNAHKYDKSVNVIKEIAETYSDLELYDLSNKFWFDFLDKAPKERQSEAYIPLAENYYNIDK